MAGALDLLRTMLEGYSFRASSPQRLGSLSRMMKQRISPEEMLVLHAGPKPIKQLYDFRGLYGTTDPRIVNLYANTFGNYLTPLIAPRSRIIENPTASKFTSEDLRAAQEQDKILSYDSYLDVVPRNWRGEGGRWTEPELRGTGELPIGYHNQVYAPRQDLFSPYFSKYVHGGLT